MFVRLLILLACSLSLVAVEIKGIYVTNNASQVVPAGRDAHGVELQFNVPGSDAKFIAKLQTFIGKPLTNKTTLDIKSAILSYYRDHNKLYIEVTVPKQNSKNGVLQIVIRDIPYRKSAFKGEIYYSDDQLSRMLSVSQGQQIALDTLQNNLSWLNRNPFHQTTMKVVPDPKAGVFDIEFASKSRRQLRFYERMSNTGSLRTGYGRFSTGFAWGNALWIGDLFSFEWTTSNYFSVLQNFTANYTAFLSWKHLFTTFATYAIVKPPNPTNRIVSKAFQIKPRYTIPLRPLYLPFQQSITIGFDYKYTNSNVLNLRTPIVGINPDNPTITQINITQAYFNYSVYDVIGPHSLSFSLDFTESPFAWVALQSSRNFEKNNTHSRHRYFYFNLTAADVIDIPKTMIISLLARAQLASNTLPSTEEDVLGGYNTVRGYHQNEVDGDNTFVGNLELRTQPIRTNCRLKDKLTLLGFLDYGYAYLYFVDKARKGKPQQPNGQYLLGIGPGLRYEIPPYVQIRADYGFKLHQVFAASPQQRAGQSKFGAFHFGALLSY